MKSFIVVCLSLFVGLTCAGIDLYPRGCIYVNGRCHEGCPVGTHSYTVGCGPVTPEPTCKDPNPVQERGIVCDYSSCYCDPPTLKDEKTGKCVLKEDCSPQDSVPTVTLLPPFEEPKLGETSDATTSPVSETPAPPEASPTSESLVPSEASPTSESSVPSEASPAPVESEDKKE